MILAKLSLVALALLPQETPQDQPQEKPPAGAIGGLGIVGSKDKVQVVNLANGGFLLKSGNFSILIDAFVKEEHDGYEALPKKALRKLQKGEKPFNGFTFALVSNALKNNFQPRVCERFLKSNPQAALMSSPQVVNRLVNGSEEFRAIKLQARAINVEPGEVKAIDRGEMNMGVQFFHLDAAGADEDTKLVNYAHLVEVSGFTILHVGAAAAEMSVFEPYELEKKDIDIAIVPFWFFLTEEGVRVIDEAISPNYTIVCRLPVEEKALFIERMKIENPHVIAFQNTFDSKIFDRSTETAEAATDE